MCVGVQGVHQPILAVDTILYRFIVGDLPMKIRDASRCELRDYAERYTESNDDRREHQWSAALSIRPFQIGSKVRGFAGKRLRK